MHQGFNTTQTASESRYFNVSFTSPQAVNNASFTYDTASLTFPAFWLPPLWTIESLTSSIDVADQWSQLYLLAYQTDEQEEAHDFAVIEKAITAQNG